MSKLATHFKATPREKSGFAITLYRFKEVDSVSRPQYLGPLGWQYHCMQKDEDVIKQLHPIDKLFEMTGEDIQNNITREDNIYAGYIFDFAEKWEIFPKP